MSSAGSSAFEGLVEDAAFQAAACADEPHRIFLFQAVFSALVAASVEPARIRLAPPTYDYPYNLHARVPQAAVPRALDDLVCFAYEGRSLDPATVKDIEIREPLRSWLRGRLESATGGPERAEAPGGRAPQRAAEARQSPRALRYSATSTLTRMSSASK